MIKVMLYLYISNLFIFELNNKKTIHICYKVIILLWYNIFYTYN